MDAMKHIEDQFLEDNFTPLHKIYRMECDLAPSSIGDKLGMLDKNIRIIYLTKVRKDPFENIPFSYLLLLPKDLIKAELVDRLTTSKSMPLVFHDEEATWKWNDWYEQQLFNEAFNGC